MSGGFRVDPDALDRTATAIEGLKSKVGEVQQQAAKANVAEVSWGQLGLVLGMYGDYRQSMQEFQDFLRQMSDGTVRAAAKLGTAAQAYRTAEDRSKTELAALAKEIDSLPKGSTPPGGH